MHFFWPLQFMVILISFTFLGLGCHWVAIYYDNVKLGLKAKPEDSGSRAKPLKSCHKTLQLMATLDYKHFICSLAHVAWQVFRCIVSCDNIKHPTPLQ